MKIYTPVDAAKKAGNKYLGVLVAAKFARYLNEFPRDHLDTGSVASPNRETEGMKDGTDAVAVAYVETEIGHGDDTRVIWGVGMHESITTAAQKAVIGER